MGEDEPLQLELNMIGDESNVQEFAEDVLFRSQQTDRKSGLTAKKGNRSY